MPPQNLRSAVEALLFSSDQPLTLAQLADALEAAEESVTEALGLLGDEYRAREAGVEVREMAGGWIITTTSEQNEWVTRMLRGKRKMRLSRAALETLAIIAYKQPVTKSEIEAIRGVDSSGTLATLLERSLVTIKGRSTVVGRPLLYGSTPDFLNYFGLKDLTELPRPEELRALVAAREPEQLEMMELDPEGMPLALAANAEGVAALADREPVAESELGVALLDAPEAEADEDGLVDDEEFEEFEGDDDDDDAELESDDDDDADAEEDAEDDVELDDEDDEDGEGDDLDDDLDGLDDLDRDGEEDEETFDQDKSEKKAPSEELEEAFLVGSDLETASDSDDDDDSDDEDEYDDDDDEDDDYEDDGEDDGDLEGDDDERPGAELHDPKGR